MDMMQPALLGQLVVAASVCYAMHITFFKTKVAERQSVRQMAPVKAQVKQRSERWAV